MFKKIYVLLLILCVLSMGSAWASEETVPFPSFEAENLNAETDEMVTEAVFADADITLVNCWATWCPPCIAELPELQELSAMTDGKVQVVSILADAVDITGERDENAIDAMDTLVEGAKVTYPVLYPDENLLTVLSMLSGYPTTFIVDRDGNVWDVAVGSNNALGWLAAAQNVADQAYPDENIVLLSDAYAE